MGSVFFGSPCSIIEIVKLTKKTPQSARIINIHISPTVKKIRHSVTTSIKIDIITAAPHVEIYCIITNSV